MSYYRDIVIETYLNHGEPSNASVRARPLPGQGLPIDTKVECSRDMRANHPVGTKFVLVCKLTEKEGGKPFLYSNPSWAYRVVTDEEAMSFILRFKSSKRS